MSRITRALLALALLALAAPASAAAAPGLTPVGDFAAPTHLTAPPGDTSRVFVVEQGGAIQVIRNGTRLATPFLDISSEVDAGGERGLLSMTFPSDYAQSGLFYVYMVARAPAGEIQVREYRRSSANADVADPAGRIVFRATHDQAANHNGGQVAWGPDGKLWFATGDGGGGNDQFGHARDLSSPLGKLLRIDPRPTSTSSYTVPADNPFASAVWAYGLRNPFRFSFDRATGDLFIGDVGQAAREEIDWVRAADGRGRGTDFEWSCREGTVAGPNPCTPAEPHTPPIFDYASRPDGHAVTGGFVVRDPGLPSLVGRYLYADFFAGAIRSFIPAQPSAVDDQPTGMQLGNLSSFGEDACGRVYVVSLSGPVARIQDGQHGQPSPCGPADAAPPATGAPDRTSPRVTIRLARKGRVGRHATPRILLRASESCRVTVTARLAGTRLRRVRTPLRGDRRTVVRLRPRARAVKRIRRALRRHRRVTLTVSVTAVDAAGNTGRVKKRLKVRRG